MAVQAWTAPRNNDGAVHVPLVRDRPPRACLRVGFATASGCAGCAGHGREVESEGECARHR